MNLKELQEDIHQNAVEKGWWETPNIPEKICMAHSELSEAVDDFRNSRMDVSIAKDGKPEGFPVELADTLIRVLDIAEHFGYDMDMIVKMKMKYNQTRPYRHGGKRS
jgi:NTP pyrophosphatase (non-canonical NTP hydrolase)